MAQRADTFSDNSKSINPSPARGFLDYIYIYIDHDHMHGQKLTHTHKLELVLLSVLCWLVF